MEKDSKGAGLAKGCAWCGHVIVDQGDMEFSGIGFGKIRLKCTKCAKFSFFEFGTKTKIFFKITKAFLVIFIVLFALHGVFAKKVNCSSFKNQLEAQTTFNSNPIKYSRLDSNNNKIACEMNDYRK